MMVNSKVTWLSGASRNSSSTSAIVVRCEWLLRPAWDGRSVGSTWFICWTLVRPQLTETSPDIERLSISAISELRLSLACKGTTGCNCRVSSRGQSIFR